VGSRLRAYDRSVAGHPAVGALISNDDWGYKSQTMISPEDLRRYAYPWHRQIVETAHGAGKPIILHSCGCLDAVLDDIIDDLKYDGKHSYEDAIHPVEEMYDRWHRRIAILGGIDMDFICRSSPEAVYERSRKMLERAEADGSYALGTGNSVPEYIPDPQYFAMLRAAVEGRD
jgi:uroporphyrinogen decarboxylase